jgi:tetratricopeptide (TPR) repeat protein
MNSKEHADEIEGRGFDYLREERWSDARECFEEMLTLPLSPMCQAKVLENIMGTYDKEGMRDEAIRTGEKALDIIENHNLWHASNDGAILRGRITGHLARLRREPTTAALDLPIAVLAAYFTGAAVGAAIGAQIQVESVNIRGPVLTDLRYGGAGIGALFGLWLLVPLFRMRPILSVITGLFNLGVLFYILTSNDFKQGIAVFGLVLLIPVGLFFYVRSRA